MTKDEMIAQAYSIIDDADGAIPPAEMGLHLEDVALDFSRRARVMRGQKAVSFFANKAILTLPEDCHELVRVIDAKNLELCPLSKSELPRSFEDDSAAVPEAYTRDYTGPEQITLYPKPTADGTLTLYYIQQHVLGQELQIPARYHLTLVYGLASKALARSPNPADLAKLERFGGAYEAGVTEALKEATKNFSSRPRRTRVRFL